MHSTSAAPGSQPQFARRPACQPARSRRGTRDAAPRQGRTEGKGYTRSSPPSPGFQSGLRYLHARGGRNASSHGRLPARLRGLPSPHGKLFVSPPPLPLLPLPPPRLTRCWSPAACRPPCRSPCVLESSRRGLQQGRKGRVSVRPNQCSSQVSSGSRAGKAGRGAGQQHGFEGGQQTGSPPPTRVPLQLDGLRLQAELGHEDGQHDAQRGVVLQLRAQRRARHVRGPQRRAALGRG